MFDPKKVIDAVYSTAMKGVQLKEYSSDDLEQCLATLKEHRPEVLALLHKVWNLSKSLKG